MRLQTTHLADGGKKSFMYAYIKGTLEEIRPDRIVVDNHGIGYEIQVAQTLIDALPAKGESVKIYTLLHVREDQMALFGFLTQDDLALFQMLIGVSGIGPKGGLSILSILSADELRFAIASEDDKAIAKASGIGKKTAQKVVIELKDKIHLEDALENLSETSGPLAGERSMQRQEALEALVALGYSHSDAASVLANVPVTEDADTEGILKEALRQLSIL